MSNVDLLKKVRSSKGASIRSSLFRDSNSGLEDEEPLLSGFVEDSSLVDEDDVCQLFEVAHDDDVTQLDTADDVTFLVTDDGLMEREEPASFQDDSSSDDAAISGTSHLTTDPSNPR